MTPNGGKGAGSGLAGFGSKRGEAGIHQCDARGRLRSVVSIVDQIGAAAQAYKGKALSANAWGRADRAFATFGGRMGRCGTRHIARQTCLSLVGQLRGKARASRVGNSSHAHRLCARVVAP